MAAFEKLDWTRLDVFAIVACNGLATITEKNLFAAHSWLERNGYAITTFDCSDGLDAAIPKLGQLLNWDAQFGYQLDGQKRNLDALRDGFPHHGADERRREA